MGPGNMVPICGGSIQNWGGNSHGEEAHPYKPPNSLGVHVMFHRLSRLTLHHSV